MVLFQDLNAYTDVDERPGVRSVVPCCSVRRLVRICRLQDDRAASPADRVREAFRGEDVVALVALRYQFVRNLSLDEDAIVSI